MSSSTGVLAQLPGELHYLIAPALEYGAYQTDAQRSRFLERASDEEMEELATIAERYRLGKHADLVSDYFDDCPITDHPESAKLYWLFGIMDQAGLQLSPEDWNSVESHIKSLGRSGSFRLASERAIAAKFLAGFREKGRAAIPALRRALEDEDLRVRVWAHFALAHIEGNRAEHEQAVRAIYAKHDRKDELGCHLDDVGAEACEAIEKFLELDSE